MNDLSLTLVTIGALLLIGVATDAVGRRTALPRVTLLLLFGFAIGPSALALLPDVSGRWFPVLADMALLMIGFLLGEKLAALWDGQERKVVVVISLSVVAVTVCVVLGGLLIAGVSATMALVLAAIATSTAPAATTDVVREVGARGSFTDTLLGIVALDDAWGLIAFSILVAVAVAVSGQGGAAEMFLTGLREVGGAVALGVFLGAPMAYLTGRIRPGEPTLAEALGLVFLCGGLAHWLDVSFLLAAMVMGATVAKLAIHHERPFHAIEQVEWPFMVLFFVLAGATIDLDALWLVGPAGAAFIALRIIARFAGVVAGAALSGADGLVRRWMALALMPQAGVAIGMALVASHRFPEIGAEILAVAIGATVFFELVGPVLTRLALVKAGEA